MNLIALYKSHIASGELHHDPAQEAALPELARIEIHRDSCGEACIYEGSRHGRSK